MRSITNYRHPRCYANQDGDCSPTISKEHFISEVLLRRLNEGKKTAKISGLQWQTPESFNLVPISGLASNILCERHNNVLAGLDAQIGKFTQAIHDFDQQVSGVAPTIQFSGHDIERWMLKCVVGMASSGNVKSRVKPECVDILFGRVPWPLGWGLYFFVGDRSPIFHNESVRVETLTDAQQLTLAAKIYLQGFPFFLCMGKPDYPSAFGIWRPSKIVFHSGDGNNCIKFSWDSQYGGPVLLTRQGTYSGPPPNWVEWERKG